MAASSGTWKPGIPSPNPHGRAPGPTAPTLLLKEAFLRAARTAGGGGPDGLHDYLAKVAVSHPAVFVSALSKIIPFEVNMRGNGNITIQIVKSADEQPVSEPQMKVINGHVNGNGSANGHTNGSSDRDNDPASE